MITKNSVEQSQALLKADNDKYIQQNELKMLETENDLKELGYGA